MLIVEGRFDEALNVLDIYVSVAPTDGRHLLLRGDIQARKGRLEEAIASWERAIEIDENRTGPAARERIDRTRRAR